MTTGDTDIRIGYLADEPAMLPQLVELFVREWGSHYGPDGPGDADADLRESVDPRSLPVCLVATDHAGSVVGTISLKSESISHHELSPWGAAMLVIPERRKAGIGTMLVAALEAEARRRGFTRLYMSTDAANSIVERRGWTAFDTAESSRGTISVYAVDL